jgi:hypothetical protein
MDEGVAQLFTLELNGRKVIGTVGFLFSPNPTRRKLATPNLEKGLSILQPRTVLLASNLRQDFNLEPIQHGRTTAINMEKPSKIFLFEELD